MRCVVCDTGPVLHLLEINALGILAASGTIIVPAEVDAELARNVPDWSSQKPTWLSIRSLEAPFASQAVEWLSSGILHVGEAQAIALARQLQADWLLTDDAAARILGRSLSVEVHGTLGVVLWAAAVGHIGREEAERCLQALSRSSMWITPRVLAEAVSALDAIY